MAFSAGNHGAGSTLREGCAGRAQAVRHAMTRSCACYDFSAIYRSITPHGSAEPDSLRFAFLDDRSFSLRAGGKMRAARRDRWRFIGGTLVTDGANTTQECAVPSPRPRRRIRTRRGCPRSPWW
ncbi:hypothetical protein EJB05_39155, partial [Eragrostis curvula]